MRCGYVRTYVVLRIVSCCGVCACCPPVPAYVELPDGKVLSGTEWGNLLLWDGGFIKVEIAKKGKKMCHHVRG